ncbi:hypothetical protein R4575_18095 [Acinetobacter baumannii]|nr:hypothetical protein [Acinetobacter baumannii]
MHVSQLNTKYPIISLDSKYLCYFSINKNSEIKIEVREATNVFSTILTLGFDFFDFYPLIHFRILTERNENLKPKEFKINKYSPLNQTINIFLHNKKMTINYNDSIIEVSFSKLTFPQHLLNFLILNSSHNQILSFCNNN